jgi:hypothetical protein
MRSEGGLVQDLWMLSIPPYLIFSSGSSKSAPAAWATNVPAVSTLCRFVPPCSGTTGHPAETFHLSKSRALPGGNRASGSGPLNFVPVCAGLSRGLLNI